MDDAISSSAWLQPNTFMDIIRPAVPKSPREAPAKSSTLMRAAVKQPEPTASSASVTQTDDKPQVNLSQSRPDLTALASSVSRSPLISRYPERASQIGATAVNAPSQPLEQTQASIDTSTDSTPQLINATNSESQTVSSAATVGAIADQPQLPNIFASSLAASMPDLAKESAKVANKKSLTKKVTGWSAVAVIAIGVVAGGLFINSNLNKVEFYVAASRAGFKATMPNVKPSGYNLSSVSAGSGVIEATFKGSSSNQNYSIEETKSNVSNNQLLNNFVFAKAGSNYQTINSNGRTIYVYNGHNATWATQGIWYVIQDNNSLSNSQIVKIADSM